jgi:hypothetical protein
MIHCQSLQHMSVSSSLIWESSYLFLVIHVIFFPRNPIIKILPKQHQVSGINHEIPHRVLCFVTVLLWLRKFIILYSFVPPVKPSKEKGNKYMSWWTILVQQNKTLYSLHPVITNETLLTKSRRHNSHLWSVGSASIWTSDSQTVRRMRWLGVPRILWKNVLKMRRNPFLYRFITSMIN